MRRDLQSMQNDSMIKGNKQTRGKAILEIRAAGQKSALLLVLLLILGFFCPLSMARYYLFNQDVLLLAAMVSVWTASSWYLGQRNAEIALSGWMVACIAGLTCVVGYVGHYLVLHGYALSRDEQMAVFDAQIYASGRLSWPLPELWRHEPAVLNTTFMQSVTEPVGWVSAYLPGNAMLRALVGKIADPALTGPLLSALGVVMTWLCARRLWPEEREPAAIACLLVAFSGQLQITGMTSYAMPGHLALNMTWLWLFLRGRLTSDLAALGVGFVAVGLHQAAFHPLFVAPWLVLLLWRREWGRSALYTVSYVLIGLFWLLLWPSWQLATLTGSSSVISEIDSSLWAKVSAILALNAGRLLIMPANLLRFAVWQPVALIPLALLGCTAIRRDPRVAALAGGFALTTLAMTVLMALQAHGFGYRYFHGLIGSAALLAAFGWRELSSNRPQARLFLLRSLILGAIVTFPIQCWFGSSYYGVFAKIDQKVAASRADFVLIGTEDAPYSSDLVINKPDLSNRPLRLLPDLESNPVTLAKLICRPGVIVALDGENLFRGVNEQLGMKASKQRDNWAGELTPALQAAGCRVTTLE